MAHKAGHFLIIAVLLHQQYMALNFPTTILRRDGFYSSTSPESFLLFPGFYSMCVSVCVCVSILSHADGRGWLLYWLMTHSLFQPAGGTSIMQVIFSRTAAAERLPFPTHQSYIRPNWDPLCCDSVFTRWEMAGQDFKTFLSHPHSLPPLAKGAVKLISSFRDPGARPAKTLHFMRASKGWCRITS